MATRYLTKSRFKLATECPTKLFYTGKKEYADQSSVDPFLKALAEGGFQVGELAKAYHPDGHDVETLDHDTALEETNALLKEENGTIFEAAVRFENLFIRIDVLRKRGNVFDLVEVKAKSFEDEAEFTDRNGNVATKWKPYLIDVAFQDYVLRKAFPGTVVRSHLMLADKNARTSVDGLNQHFKIEKNSDGRTQARMVGDVSPKALGEKILKEVDVQKYVQQLQTDTYEVNGSTYSFEEYISFLANRYKNDERVPLRINCKVCAECQFRATPEEEAQGKLSGYKSCWKEAKNFSDEDFAAPSVLDIWYFDKSQAQELLDDGRYFIRDIDANTLGLKGSREERQRLQIKKTKENDTEPWIDYDGLRQAFEPWKWPLHFIDFEASSAAIPFTKGRYPYEAVVFQFSHHQVNEDGSIEHVDEYLNVEPGVFPNFEFVRRLKASLDKDNGTIFQYSPYENTKLNQIRDQLEGCEEDVADRDELIEWIKTITKDRDGCVGDRNMVDLQKLVVGYYYQLDMGGSNSIKDVLPAVLNSSKYLQDKYCQPIYKSRNFPEQIWLQKDNAGRVIDPYKLLPPIFADIPQEDIDKISADESLADGGAAMTAYARLQFSDVSDVEREAIRKALLRYCELDTLAMVMIWEAWNDALAREGKSV